MNVLREDIANFVNNPCWQSIKEELVKMKLQKYAVATAEETRVPVVKSCMDKISVIDEILEIENEFIKQYNNPQGETR